MIGGVAFSIGLDIIIHLFKWTFFRPKGLNLGNWNRGSPNNPLTSWPFCKLRGKELIRSCVVTKSTKIPQRFFFSTFANYKSFKIWASENPQFEDSQVWLSSSQSLDKITYCILCMLTVHSRWAMLAANYVQLSSKYFSTMTDVAQRDWSTHSEHTSSAIGDVDSPPHHILKPSILWI